MRIMQVVQIDGLVIMKLIKHCHELEASTSGSGIAQGALLGLVTDTRLEITHCFPFPSGTDETVDDEDFCWKRPREAIGHPDALDSRARW